MSKNQRSRPKEVTNPHRDLPLQARLALVDYLAELTRQSRGVRPVAKSPIPDPFQVPFQGPEDTGIKGVPKLRDTKKKSPAQAIVDSLGMNALTAHQVADTLGVSMGKIRKLMEVEELNAPSYEVPFGRSKIYIYTPEDVDELRTYLIKERTPTPRRKT